MDAFWICVIIGLIPFILYFRWFIIQWLIVYAVIASNIAYQLAPDAPLVALWCGIALALLFTAATNKATAAWRRLAARLSQPWGSHRMSAEEFAVLPQDIKDMWVAIQEPSQAEIDSKYPDATREIRP